MLDDTYFMNLALNEARLAQEAGEIPIGCVIVCNEIVIAKAHNLTQTLNDVTAHAEIQAFSAAAEYLGAKYLKDCTLYVNVEPCPMCAAASYWTQIGKIVYGTKDTKHAHIDKKILLHPKTVWVGGVLEAESAKIMQDFFQKKRM